MNELIIRLVSDKIKINGETCLQPPQSGLRRKIFDYFSKTSFDASHNNIENFEIGELINVLKQVQDLFKENNHAFQIDINKEQWVDLQIIHPIMISDKIPNEKFKTFGFVIYWTNNSSLEIEKNLTKVFSESDLLKDYVHFHSDGTDCYSFICWEDLEKVVEVSRSILLDVLGHDKEDKYYFSISDHGLIES
ncbi:MAG: hypothetical protein ACPGSD_13450 [Flavobacteriales bacterium]